MMHLYGARRGMAAPVAVLALASGLMAESYLSQLKTVRNPGKRSERALKLADSAFDNARGLYEKGEIQKGDAALDQMNEALTACLQSAEIANKPKYYKKAELNVAKLQRQLKWLLNDLDVWNRSGAKAASKKMDQIHNQLLAGVMRRR